MEHLLVYKCYFKQHNLNKKYIILFFAISVLIEIYIHDEKKPILIQLKRSFLQQIVYFD